MTWIAARTDAPARPASRLRVLLLPALTTIAMLAVLIALGIWQVARLHWKHAILAQIARAEAEPPAPLTDASPPAWSKVSVTGRLRHDLAVRYGAEVRDTRAGPTMGSELVVPLERADAPPVLVDRGWVPEKREAPLSQPADVATIVGYVHPPDRPGWFSARDDLPGRQFFTLDPSAIGRAIGLPTVAPFTIIALDTAPSGGSARAERWPDPARHLPRPPDNHLSYAITWFGLAAALVVIFLLWARKALHR